MKPQLYWKLDEYSIFFGRFHVRGWCHYSEAAVNGVELLFERTEVWIRIPNYGEPSPDVAAVIGAAAGCCRFEAWLDIAPDIAARDFLLRAELADGGFLVTGSVHQNANDGDPYHRCWVDFLRRLDGIPRGMVLEIGSRARSAITRREIIPRHLEYVGLDILPGRNVDIVGDAHELSRLFGARRFVAAFSFSVFEHLVMPWKVAIELNKVLCAEGLVFTQSHQTWPAHEEPWDFWRFSIHSWRAIFNAATGFEVLNGGCGEPAAIYAARANAVTRDLPAQPAYLGSASIVRKIGETTLSWPVPTEVAAAGMYPQGELPAPPC